MSDLDVLYAGLAEHARMVREGEISSRELVALSVERAIALEPQLNAFSTIEYERALADAAAADQRGPDPTRPLHGVPIAIKDNFDERGRVTTHGTNAFGGPAGADAALVARLREAGAVFVGRTLLPELALWGVTESATWGATRNPWDAQRSPGGSSGGSGAVVAAGVVGAAVASDGLGSIRIPAARCGLVGLKPQRGRIRLAPADDHWHGLSVAGVLTRRVADTALFVDTVAARPGEPYAPGPLARPLTDAASTPPGSLRVAVSERSPVVGVTPDAPSRAGMEAIAAALGSLGHRLARRDPDYGSPLVFGALLGPRFLRGAHDEAGRLAHPRRLERRTRTIVRMGRAISPALVRRARRAEGDWATQLNRLFDDHDLLVTPTVAERPPRVGRWEGRGAMARIVTMLPTVPYTGPWNLSGQPAIAVPAGFDADGLPQSAQLIAPPGREDLLISVAAQLEAELRWAEHRPPLN